MKLMRWLIPPILAACVRAQPAPELPAARLLLTHVHVWGASDADAVLVVGSKIAAVGHSAELRAKNPHAVERDGDSGWLLPGFHDCHVHLLSGGMALRQPALEEARSVAEIVALLADYARANPHGAWILGRGWKYDIVPSGTFPKARALDGIDSRPIFLESYDGHTAWVNSRALALAGLAGLPGRSDGTLREGDMALVEKLIPEPSREEKASALRAALLHLSARGVTTAHHIGSDHASVDILHELARAGDLPLRVIVGLPLEGELESYQALRNQDDELVRVGFVKGFLDGVIESRTAFMLAPYTGHADRGAPLIPEGTLHHAIAAAQAAGLPVALHSTGDAAVRKALDVLPHGRHRIEHIEVIDTLDIPRFAQIGIFASMQPYHAYPAEESPEPGVWSQNIGAERLPRTFAWRALADAGATLLFGSDWPVMAAEPFWGLAVAVSRQDENGHPEGGWNAHQALSLEQAVAAYTTAAALWEGTADRQGQIRPGFDADLVLLAPDFDPKDAHTFWQPDLVRLVLMGGVVRFDASPLER